MNDINFDSFNNNNNNNSYNIDGSNQSKKIEVLLKNKLPVDEISKTLDLPIDAVKFYISNRNIPDGQKLSIKKISKIETLLSNKVSHEDISTVLDLDPKVITTFLENKSFLNYASPNSISPNSINSSLDFLKYLTQRSEDLRPYIDSETYQDLDLKTWQEYKASTLKLHWAVENNQLHLFSKNSGDLHKRNAQGLTPLDLACAKNMVMAIKPLLDMGAKKNLPGKNGYTPIFYAVLNNHKEVIRELAKYNININHISSDKEKNTPLFLAVSKNKANSVEALVEKGANVNHKNHPREVFTPFSYAARNCPENVFKPLLARGKIDEMTLFYCACSTKERLEKTKLLFNRAANQLKPFVSRAMYLFSYTTTDDDSDLALFLLKHGADPSFQDFCYGSPPAPTSSTTLFYAVSYNKLKCVEIMLENGGKKIIDKNYTPRTDVSTNTILFAAIDRGFDKMGELLVNAGAKIFPNKKGLSLEELAKRKKCFLTLKAIEERKNENI